MTNHHTKMALRVIERLAEQFALNGKLLGPALDQLENFAGTMNFVIFPMFFASSALYPLWKMREGSLTLYYICLYNPFTWAVELIRFSFYLKMNWEALAVVALDGSGGPGCERRRLRHRHVRQMALGTSSEVPAHEPWF